MKLLNKIQQDLHAPKGQKNEFGGYNYRSAEDILKSVKPLLGDGWLKLSDEVVEIGGRVYVKATATLFDGEHTVEASAYAREQASRKGMDEAQVTGAASSYARKYALSGLFSIDNEKDPDTKDNSKQGKQQVNTSFANTPLEMDADQLANCQTLEQLADAWRAISKDDKPALLNYKDELKARLS